MRRAMSTVLEELGSGLMQSATHAGMRLSAVEMSLPMDLMLVLRDGGVTMLADVPRSRADAVWRDAQASCLRIRWQALDPNEEAAQ